MRILEFKPKFSEEQKVSIDRWLSHLRHIWNIAVNEFEKLDNFTYFNKEDNTRYPRSPLTWQYRYINLNPDGSLIEKTDKDKSDSSSTALSKPTLKPKQKVKSKKKKEKSDDDTIVATAYREVDGKLEWFSLKSGWIAGGDRKVKFLAPFNNIVDRASYSRYIKYLPESKNVTTDRAISDRSVYTTADLQKVRGWFGADNCTGYSCPVSIRAEPTILGFDPKTKGGAPTIIVRSDVLPTLIADSICPEFKDGKLVMPEIDKVPYEYKQGVINGLCQSWEEYRKSRSGQNQLNRGKPKHKPKSKPLTTLVSGKSKTAKIIDRNTISLPAIGRVEVPTLDKRWINSDGGIPDIKTFKIVKRASGYYLQLTGDVKRSPKVSPKLLATTKIVGIDPGLKSWLSFSDGTEIENPRYLRKVEEKKKKLQRDIDAKLTHNLILWLCKPNRQPEDFKQFCPGISTQKATQAIGLKTISEIVEALGSGYGNKLKWAVGYSNRVKELQLKVKLLEEKVKLRRKHFTEKQSTWIVRKHQTIVIEDGMQSANLRKKAKAKLNQEKNCYDRNNSSAKSGLNKSLADGGHGALISALKRKGKAIENRRVIEHPARGTTQCCPVCDTNAHIDLSVRWYKCTTCGFEGDRDRKSGIYMLVHSYLNGLLPKEHLDFEILQVLADREKWFAGESSCKVGKTTRKRKNKAA